MDNKISRWAQLVWMEKDDLEVLHHREKLLATRSGSLRAPLFLEKNLATWQMTELIEITTARISPAGFWPKDFSELDKASSMKVFERSIYPIWMGIEVDDKERENAMSNEQVVAQGILLECLTMHRQDMAILESGFKPVRVAGDQDRIRELRQKAARAGA